MKPEIIVFDLYNTLVYIKERQQFFTKIFQYGGSSSRLMLSRYFDLLITKDLEILLQDLPQSFQKAYHKYLPELSREVDSVELFPETIQVLEELSIKFELYLISNLASPYKKPFFELGLAEYFKGTLFSCDFGDRKPNPPIFKEVEKLSQKSGEQILIIGDSLNSDIEGAKVMHWNYLQIIRNISTQKEWQINSLTEIEEKLSN